jgi:hypothetical protein
LSIAEGKTLMAAVQQWLVDAQVATWSERHRCCEACGARRHSKGSHPVVFLTLYGDVQIASPRLHRCPCQSTDGPATVSPLRNLLPDYVAPERLYLEARWASLMPYAAAAGLLADILPIASGANATTVREHVLVWPSVPRPNSRRSGPASSMDVRRNGPRCRFRRDALWSASMAATSATGKTGKPTSRSSSDG